MSLLADWFVTILKCIRPFGVVFWALTFTSIKKMWLQRCLKTHFCQQTIDAAHTKKGTKPNEIARGVRKEWEREYTHKLNTTARTNYLFIHFQRMFSAWGFLLLLLFSLSISLLLLLLLFISSLSFIIIRVRLNRDQWGLSINKLCMLWVWR